MKWKVSFFSLILLLFFFNQELDAHEITYTPLTKDQWKQRISSFFDNNTYKTNLSQTEPGLNVGELQKIGAQSNFETVDDLLTYLAKDRPEIMKSPAAALYTRSLHHADPEHPRIQPINEDGRLMMAFSTRPDDSSYHRLETIEFDLEAILEDPDAQAYKMLEARTVDGKLHWEDVSSNCASCHSTRPGDNRFIRPIWDGYPHSARFIGGLRDTPEVAWSKSTSIIQRLNKKRSQPNSRLSKIGPITDDELPLNDVWEKLHFWNMFRLARKIESHPEYSKLRYALFAAIDISEKTRKEDLVAEAFGAHGSSGYQEYIRRYQKLMKEYSEALRRHFTHYTEVQGAIYGYDGRADWSDWTVAYAPPDAGEDAEYEEANIIDYMTKTYAEQTALIGAALSFLDIDLRDYSTQLTRGTPYFGGNTDLELDNLVWLLIDDWNGLKSEHEVDQHTAAWIQESQRRLAEFEHNDMPEKFHWSAEQLFASDCSSCHRSGNLNGATTIHFDDPVKFANQLTNESAARIISRLKDSSPHTRMPLFYPPWSPDEISTAETYMNKILILKQADELTRPQEPECHP